MNAKRAHANARITVPRLSVVSVVFSGVRGSSAALLTHPRVVPPAYFLSASLI